MWSCLEKQFQKQLDETKEELCTRKAENRRLIQEQLDKTNKQLDDMRTKITELEVEKFQLSSKLKTANKTIRDVKKSKEYWRNVAKNNIAKLKSSQDEVIDLKDAITDLNKTIENMDKKHAATVQKELMRLQGIVDRQNELISKYKTSKREMKRVRVKGRRGGSGSWDLWVVQLCCELLVIGAPPSTIPKSISTIYETLYSDRPDETPSVSFVRQCRILLQIIGETVVAMKLTKAKVWDQLHMDATTRRHCSFNAIVVGIINDNLKMESVIMSSCIIMKDDTAATTAQTLWDMVSHVTISIVLPICHC